MPKTIAWSWSRLNDFEQCPRKFQGKYVTKEFPKGDFDAPHFRKGKAVHKALEDYLSDGVVIPYPIVYKGEKFFVDLKYLTRFLNTLHAAPEKLIEENICFDMNLGRLSWYDKQAWCRVIMDAIVVIGDYALVVDWKTGKVGRHSDQLKLFAAAAFQMYPQVRRVTTAYIWCEHPTTKPLTASYTYEQKDDLWHEFGDRAELIQMANESGNWPAKKNMFCKWCDALPNQCDFKECD